MEKKDAAKALYFEGWSQKRISSVLKVSENSISKWKRDGNWEETRTEHSLARASAEENVLELINYQLFVLKLRKDKCLKAYEESKSEDELKLIERGDIDALQKLFASIKSKQQTWASLVAIIRDFTEFLNEQDIKLSKKLLPFADEFLNLKRKEV